MRKVFGDVIVTPLEDGRWNVDYGPSRGSETFDNGYAAMDALEAWSLREVGILSKRLESLMKLYRYAAKR